MSNEVTEVAESNDVDMDWDNIEDVAPSMETQSEEVESEEENTEEDSSTDIEDESEVAEDAPEESPEKQPEDKDAKEEVTEDAEEAPAEIELSEPLQAQGLVSKDGEIGKMVKIDGEDTFVNLKDLGNDFSGSQAVAKRFNEFNVKEQEFKREMNEVNEYITDLGATMRDSSIMEGVAKIGELVGFPPHVLKEALIREIAPELERRYGLSEEELALESKNQENEYLKKQIESDGTKLQQEQAQRELDTKVLNLRETHNISRDEWQELESNLLANDYKREEVTPELVVKYKGFRQAESRATSIVSEFDSSYLENQEVMNTLVDEIFDSPDLSDEDFREILSEALGESKKVDAVKKVDAALEAKAKKQSKPKEGANGVSHLVSDEGNEIDDWDDLL